MQYFPSLLHTMVHRMRFSAFYPSHHSSSSEPTLARRTAFSGKQKHRTSRGKTSVLLPRKHGTFPQRSPRFSISEKNASPPPPHEPHKKYTKASPTETLHTTNLTPRPPKPHPSTLKTTQNTPRKRHLPTQSENISKIIPKTFGRYTHTTYLCIIQRNKDRFSAPRKTSRNRKQQNSNSHETTGSPHHRNPPLAEL